MKNFSLIKRLASLVAAALFLQAAVANASPALDRISKTDTLRVGMSAAQPPFNMKNRDGDVIGMDVDLANLLADSMNVQLEIVQMPFGKLLGALQKGEVDLVLSGVTATLERNRKVPFVGPYFVSGTSILTKAKVLESIDTEEELAAGNWRVAVLKGSTSQQFVENVMQDPQVTATDTQQESVKLLLDDKVDAVVADGPLIALSLLRNPNAGLVALNQPLTIEPISIAVVPNDPLFLNLVQNYMQALEATGMLESLTVKWFRNAAWLAQMP